MAAATGPRLCQSILFLRAGFPPLLGQPSNSEREPMGALCKRSAGVPASCSLAFAETKLALSEPDHQGYLKPERGRKRKSSSRTPGAPEVLDSIHVKPELTGHDLTSNYGNARKYGSSSRVHRGTHTSLPNKVDRNEVVYSRCSVKTRKVVGPVLVPEEDIGLSKSIITSGQTQDIGWYRTSQSMELDTASWELANDAERLTTSLEASSSKPHALKSAKPEAANELSNKARDESLLFDVGIKRGEAVCQDTQVDRNWARQNSEVQLPFMLKHRNTEADKQVVRSKSEGRPSGSKLSELQLKLVAKLRARLHNVEPGDTVEQILSEHSEELTLPVISLILKQETSWRSAMHIYDWMKAKGLFPNLYVVSYILNLAGLAKQLSAAELLFQDIQQQGYKIDAHVHNIMISAYIRAGQKHKALDWFQKLEASGFELNQVLYTTGIKLYTQAGKHGRAVELCTVLTGSPDFKPDKKAFCTVIHAFSKAGQHAMCTQASMQILSDLQSVFDEMLSLGIEPDAATWNALVASHSRAGDPSKAAQVLQQMKEKGSSPGPEAYNSLLSAYAKTGSLPVAERVFQEMLEAGVRPTLVSYNTLLHLYSIKARATAGSGSGGGFVAKAERLVAEMAAQSVALDKMSYSTLMQLYGAAGLLREAEQWYQQMLSKAPRLEMDLQVHSTRISMYAAHRRDAEAAQACVEMQAQGFRPDAFVASTMVAVFRRLGRLDDAERAAHLLQEAGDAGADDVASTSAIVHHARRGQLAKCEAIFGDLRAQGRPLAAAIYNAMLDAYSTAGSLEKAEEVYALIKASGENARNVVTYTSMMRAYGRANRPELAKAVFNDMTNSGCKLDAVSYNTMLHVLQRNRQWRAAARLFSQMERDPHCSPSVVTYTCMIDMYGKAEKLIEATRMFAKLREAGLRPSTVTYNVMIKMYGRAEMISDAAELFRTMAADGAVPDVFTYNALIGMYRSAGLLQEAMRLHGMMGSARLAPDQATFVLMAKVYEDSNNPLLAAEMMRAARQTGKPRNSRSSTRRHMPIKPKLPPGRAILAAVVVATIIITIIKVTAALWAGPLNGETSSAHWKLRLVSGKCGRVGGWCGSDVE
eukprot:jgi/Mesen1/9481/ME000063S08929